MSKLNWYSAKDPPLGREAVWGFCPDIGNDDEGYGIILPVIYETLHLHRGLHKPCWIDIAGTEVNITKWAFLIPPEVPEEWISSEQPK